MNCTDKNNLKLRFTKALDFTNLLHRPTETVLMDTWLSPTNLLPSVEQPLPLRLHLEQLHDLNPQVVHLRQLGQGVHPVGLLAIHSAHLNPHCSSPAGTQKGKGSQIKER